MTASPVVDVSDLTKSFGDVEALRGVSLQVESGEIFGLLGRNGSGKTTTIRILTGLATATSGRARVGGYDLASDAKAAQQLMGVTLQDAAIDTALTGREFLQLVGRLWSLGAKGSRTRAGELLELFGLEDSGDRRIGTYSGGMQRRLDVAASLVVRPQILFLDEPTTGLDPQNRRALWVEIEKLRANGTTVFLTTQYLEEAEELADRIAIMDVGRIVDTDTPAGLRIRHGATSVTVAPRDGQIAALRELAASRGLDADLIGDSLRVAVASSSAAFAFVNDASALHGDIGEVEIRQDSLEDVFLNLTGTGVTAEGAA